jgi:dolichyl-phosphate beta-glucosyltransferase
MNPIISIVLPAYNESERIVDPLAQVIDFVGSAEEPIEILVVDDGSGDDTAEVARQVLSQKPDITSDVIRYEENRGKGFAVKTGTVQRRGPFNADRGDPQAR